MGPPPRVMQALAKASGENNKEREYCKVCDVYFTSYNAFHHHKVNSPSHVTCHECSADFATLEALKRHRDQNHAIEQDIQCAGCGRDFTRAAGLISHIENKTCSKNWVGDDIVKYREKKQQMAAQLKALQGTGWEHPRLVGFNKELQRDIVDPKTGGPVDTWDKARFKSTFRDEKVKGADGKKLDVVDLWDQPVINKDAAGEKVNDVKESAGDSWVKPQFQAGAADNNKATPASTVKADFSWDWPTAYSTPKLETKLNDAKAFPLLPGQKSTELAKPTILDAPITEKVGRDNWAPMKFVQDIPDAVAPPTELLNAMTIATGENDETFNYNPDRRDFNAEVYYNRFTLKYKCPYKRCKKSLDKAHALVQHLKSSSHHDSALRCPGCFRYFKNSTALTQHCESQGVRCKVRETNDYGKAIDEATGGFIGLAGHLPDDTIKYQALDPTLRGANIVVGIVEANKKANEKKDRDFYTYWERHQPKW